jgi:hypothetical protein
MDDNGNAVAVFQWGADIHARRVSSSGVLGSELIIAASLGRD